MTNHIARKVVQAFRTPTTRKIRPENYYLANWKPWGCYRNEIPGSLDLSHETVHHHFRYINEKRGGRWQVGGILLRI